MIRFFQKWLLTLSFLLTAVAAQAQFTVTGKVLDSETGEPLVGAGIVEVGTSNGAFCGNEGAFKLVLSRADAIVIVSMVGYEKQEVPVNGVSPLTIELKLKVGSLEEVVVIGYGTQRKEDLTGSVGVVNVSEVKKLANNSVLKALQGQVAGVQIHGSGEPGAEPQVKIRGIGTFGNNTPLYIVDGVPVVGLGDFNAQDIETMQVLKDASAAAIYGSRAANGVIIITTKHGTSGATVINYDGYIGAQTVPRKIAVTNREQYQLITNAAQINAGQALVSGNDPNSPDFINNVDTDWQNEGFKTGMIMAHNVSISGGKENLKSFLSLNYLNQDGTLSGPAPSFERVTIRANSEYKKGRLTVGESIYFMYTDRLNATALHVGNSIVDLIKAIPTMPVYDPNRLGGYGGADNQIQKAITLNVIGMNNLLTSRTNRNRFFADTYAELALLKGLSYRLNLAYNREDFSTIYTRPRYDLGWFFQNEIAAMDESRGYGYTALMENLLKYDNKFGKHQLNVVAGYTVQIDKIRDINGHAEGYTEPYFWVLNAGSTGKSISGYETEWRQVSQLGRINYDFDNRYLLTMTVRRDGSSKFAPASRHGVFPSVAAAWKVHNESFFHVPFINQLKIRGGYGVLGNQEIPTYGYSAFINSNSNYNFGGAFAAGSSQYAYANPLLRWEQSTTSSAGLDLSMWNNRLSFSAEYYYNKSKDLLVGVPIPRSNGTFDNPIVNAASMRNQGLEFTAGIRDGESDFTYDINVNLSTLNNKVLSLGDYGEPIFGNMSRTSVGSEVGALFGYVSDGLFQSQEEIDGHAFQSALTAPGDIKFRDINGRGDDGQLLLGQPDGLITAEDRMYLGSAIPKFYYGFNFNGGYKGFDLTIFMQGQSGNLIVNGVRQTLSRLDFDNHAVDMLNFWSPTNTNTDVPRPIVGDPNLNGRESIRWMENGSYLRIQNAQLGYSFPLAALTPLHLTKLRVYLSGQNLYTFTGYSGFDPDISNDGLFSRATDYGSWPNPRTYLAGIQLSF